MWEVPGTEKRQMSQFPKMHKGRLWKLKSTFLTLNCGKIWRDCFFLKNVFRKEWDDHHESVWIYKNKTCQPCLAVFLFSFFFGFIITTGLETSKGKLHLDFSKCMAKSPRQNDNDMLAARLIYSCLHGHTDAGMPLGLSK